MSDELRLSAPARVAVVDDQSENVEQLSDALSDANYEPVSLSRERYISGSELLGELKQRSVDAVLCDLRLSPGGLLGESGADVVATAYGLGLPGVLVSSYLGQDVYFDEVFPRRRFIPRVLERVRLESINALREAVEAAIDEVQRGFVPTERRALNALVSLVEWSEMSESGFARVPQWGEKEILLTKRAASLLGISNPAPNMQFLAQVNLDAASEEDLFIHEPSPIVGADELARRLFDAYESQMRGRT